MEDEVDQKTAAWTRRPLCRRYATAVFCRTVSHRVHGDPADSQAIWWCLGTLNDGGTEFLGAWKTASEKSGPPSNVFGELRDRGVLSIRFCIGNIGCADAIFKQTFQHAAAMPSFEDLLVSSAASAKPRHRLSVQDQLRSIAQLEDLAAARSEFAIFQGSTLGERYREIVEQWDEALARCQAVYALRAPLRELVRSSDRTAAHVSACLNRAIKRHGPFTGSASALDFVVAWLDKAERGLEFDRRASWASSTAGPSRPRGFMPLAGAAGMLTLA